MCNYTNNTFTWAYREYWHFEVFWLHLECHKLCFLWKLNSLAELSSLSFAKLLPLTLHTFENLSHKTSVAIDLTWNREEVCTLYCLPTRLCQDSTYYFTLKVCIPFLGVVKVEMMLHGYSPIGKWENILLPPQSTSVDAHYWVTKIFTFQLPNKRDINKGIEVPQCKRTKLWFDMEWCQINNQ